MKNVILSVAMIGLPWVMLATETAAAPEVGQASIHLTEDGSPSPDQEMPIKDRTIKEWRSHKGDRAYLLRALTLANAADQESPLYINTARDIGDEYVGVLDNSFSKDEIQQVGSAIYDSGTVNGKAVEFFLNHVAEINDVMVGRYGRAKFVQSILGDPIYETYISRVVKDRSHPVRWNEMVAVLKVEFPVLGEDLLVMEELSFRKTIEGEINQVVFKDGSPTPNWAQISSELEKRYPGFDCNSILLRVKMNYFKSLGRREEQWNASYQWMHRYRDRLKVWYSGDALNGVAWYDIFQLCDDRKVLQEAAEMMRGVVERDPDNAMPTDTYANLLYKIGDKVALVWERKAVELGRKNEQYGLYPGTPYEFHSRHAAEYLQDELNNLRKMEKGEPTWEVSTRTPES